MLGESKINKLYLIFVLFLPFSWASIAVGSIYRLITILLFALFILQRNFKIFVPMKKRRLFNAWAIYVIYSCSSVIWGGFTSQQITIAFGMALLFLISLVFIGTVVEDTESNKLDVMWIIATAFFVVLFITGSKVSLGWSTRQTLIILGTETDANEFASFFAVGLSVITGMVLSTKNIFQKTILALLFLGGIYVVLMSGSRGALLALFVAIVTTLFFSNRLSMRGLIVICIVGTVLYFVFYTFVIDLIPENTLARLSIEALTADNGSGRGFIWKNALSDFWGGNILRIIFGYGYGGLYAPTGYGTVTSTMHNQFLQNLINYGVVGFILYLRLIWLTLKEYWMTKRTYLGCFIGILVMGLTITMGPSYKILWILIMIPMLSISSGAEDECYDE